MDKISSLNRLTGFKVRKQRDQVHQSNYKRQNGFKSRDSKCMMNRNLSKKKYCNQINGIKPKKSYSTRFLNIPFLLLVKLIKQIPYVHNPHLKIIQIKTSSLTCPSKEQNDTQLNESQQKKPNHLKSLNSQKLSFQESLAKLLFSQTLPILENRQCKISQLSNGIVFDKKSESLSNILIKKDIKNYIDNIQSSIKQSTQKILREQQLIVLKFDSKVRFCLQQSLQNFNQKSREKNNLPQCSSTVFQNKYQISFLAEEHKTKIITQISYNCSKFQNNQASSQHQQISQQKYSQDYEQNNKQSILFRIKDNQSIISNPKDRLQDFSDFFLDSLSNFNEHLTKCSFNYIRQKQNYGFFSVLLHLTQNWQVYQPYIKQTEMQKFVRVFQIIQKKSQFLTKNLFPQISKLLIVIRKKANIQSFSQLVQKQLIKLLDSQQYESLEQNRIKAVQMVLKQQKRILNLKDTQILDIFKNFQEYLKLKYQQGQLQLQKMLYLRINDQSIELMKFISQSKWFQSQTSMWQDIIRSLQVSYSKKSNQEQNNFLKDVQNQRLMDNQCLGCTRFFFKNVNFQDNSVNQTSFFSFQSVQIIKKMPTQIKNILLGLLNSGGGLILTGCKKNGLQCYARGDRISQRQKQMYYQFVKDLIKSIKPSVQMGNNIMIQFVPLVANPFKYKPQGGMKQYAGDELIGKSRRVYRKRRQLQGTFVMRIRVKPSDPLKVYYWQDKNQYFLTKVKDRKIVKLSFKSIPKLMKQRFEKHYSFQNETHPQVLMMMQRPTDRFFHRCNSCDIGIPLNQALNQQMQPSEYPFISMLLFPKNIVGKVSLSLKSIDLRCMVVLGFQKYAFKSAINTGILYHFISHRDLQQQLKDPKFMFNNRSLVAIPVTRYLRLKISLNDADLNRLKEWLKAQFPTQILSYYEFITQNNKKEYYLKTQSYTSLLFMYYVVNNFNIRVTMKEPACKDSNNQQQRDQGLKLLWKSQSTSQNIDH